MSQYQQIPPPPPPENPPAPIPLAPPCQLPAAPATGLELRPPQRPLEKGRRTWFIAGAALLIVLVVALAVVGTYILLAKEGPEKGGGGNPPPPPPAAIHPTAWANITTSKGPIIVELYGNETPLTVQNFLNYTNDSFYDGTIFHRVVSEFVIQGGGFTSDLVQKTTNHPAIKLETHPRLNNSRGTLAMAREADPDSATSQFYINIVNNSFLDPGYRGGAGYSVFGRVIRGMDVVDAIASVTTSTQQNLENVPVEPVRISSVRYLASPP